MQAFLQLFFLHAQEVVLEIFFFFVERHADEGRHSIERALLRLLRRHGTGLLVRRVGLARRLAFGRGGGFARRLDLDLELCAGRQELGCHLRVLRLLEVILELGEVFLGIEGHTDHRLGVVHGLLPSGPLQLELGEALQQRFQLRIHLEVLLPPDHAINARDLVLRVLIRRNLEHHVQHFLYFLGWQHTTMDHLALDLFDGAPSGHHACLGALWLLRY